MIAVMLIPRLTEKERVILDLLEDHGELFGLDLVARSGGELLRGTVYTTLARMMDKGLLDRRTVPPRDGRGGKPVQLYSPTDLGSRVRRALLAAEDVLAGAA